MGQKSWLQVAKFLSWVESWSWQVVTFTSQVFWVKSFKCIQITLRSTIAEWTSAATYWMRIPRTTPQKPPPHSAGRRWRRCRSLGIIWPVCRLWHTSYNCWDVYSRHGFDGPALQWFRSYLTGRTQAVRQESQSAMHYSPVAFLRGQFSGQSILYKLSCYYTLNLVRFIEHHALSLHLFPGDAYQGVRPLLAWRNELPCSSGLDV